ncbi:MAG: hypothetical protein Q9226_003514, partial [Calogaya cf. arnoldii]
MTRSKALWRTCPDALQQADSSSSQDASQLQTLIQRDSLGIQSVGKLGPLRRAAEERNQSMEVTKLFAMLIGPPFGCGDTRSSSYNLGMHQ